MFEFLGACLGVVFPLFQSVRYIKKEQNEETIKVLKYWCIVTIFNVLSTIIGLVVNELFMTIASFALLLYLIMDDFSGSESIFDLTIAPLLHKHGQIIIDRVSNYEGKFQTTLNGFKDKITKEVNRKIVPQFKEAAIKTVMAGFKAPAMPDTQSDESNAMKKD